MKHAFKTYTINLRGQEFTINRPWIMGILNATPDSFYDGSRAMSPQAMERRVAQMVEEGADIIDVGAYSTRPGADEVTTEEETRRITLAMQAIRRVAPEAIVSVDTFRSHVAQVAVEVCGADIVNDVSGGLIDPGMIASVARMGVPAVVMHMRGTPATMQDLTDYDNVTTDVLQELRHTLDRWRDAGVSQLIADPGFGFSKTLKQNYELMAGLDAFHALDVPLLVGISRKSMIYKLLNTTAQDALNGTTVLNTVALLQGAHILRVHDVKAAVEARKLIECLSLKRN